jgi:hypothetical protein
MMVVTRAQEASAEKKPFGRDCRLRRRNMEIMRKLFFSLALGIIFIELSGYSQNLADVAQQDKEKRAQQKKPAKTYTNEDLSKFDHLETTTSKNPVSQTETASQPTQKTPLAAPSDNEERAWSKRFIEAKEKIAQLKQLGETLQTTLNSFSLNLLRQSDVFDREHLYPEMMSQTKEKIEKNKADLNEAERELEDLRDALRKSGNPRSWEDSQLALKPLPETEKKGPPQIKDQKYWQTQLALIDKRYDSLVTPLEDQRFQMIHRVPPKEGQSVAQTGPLGLGVPPLVIELDAQIKELNTKREQEKKDLVDQAIHGGAYPGWFR